MEVTYLPVYRPNEEEKKDAKMYAFNVRERIADFLGVLTTSHTYEDCRLMMKARELNLPLESALIEFDLIKTKLNITFENCNEILKKFTVYAKETNGKMDLNVFSHYLGLPATGAVCEVFKLYDRDNNGSIDFREFLIGLSLLSQPANTEDTLRMAFNMFDLDGKGYISLEDLEKILYNAFSMSPDQVKVLFNKIDTKNDGFITYGNLIITLKKLFN
jgi:lysophosphatidylcholine acyltransferase / lyso-PAF acetyltransferase